MAVGLVVAPAGRDLAGWAGPADRDLADLVVLDRPVPVNSRMR